MDFQRKSLQRPNKALVILSAAEDRVFVSSALYLRMTILMVLLISGIMAAGCSASVNSAIPQIPKDHPANRFYEAAQQGMLGDKVCLDNKGDPTIPIGKIQGGEGYTKSVEITPGVFYFRNDATSKIYLGVRFLQYTGFLQIPKVCAWEDKSSK